LIGMMGTGKSSVGNIVARRVRHNRTDGFLRVDHEPDGCTVSCVSQYTVHFSAARWERTASWTRTTSSRRRPG
jgi:hypothetical protein